MSCDVLCQVLLGVFAIWWERWLYEFTFQSGQISKREGKIACEVASENEKEKKMQAGKSSEPVGRDAPSCC
jgi:hypothetical protein